MVRYSASMGAAEEAGAGGGAGGGEERARSQQSQCGQRLSVPFADIGGLLPSPRSPITKSYSSGSVSRAQQKKRQLSSASASSSAYPETNLAPKRPSSWLSPSSIAHTENSNNNNTATNGAILTHLSPCPSTPSSWSATQRHPSRHRAPEAAVCSASTPSPCSACLMAEREC